MTSQDSTVEGAIDLERVEIIDNDDHIFINIGLSSEQAKIIADSINERLVAGLDFHIYGLGPGERTSTAKVLHPTAFIIFRAGDTNEASLIGGKHLVINLARDTISDFASSIADATGLLFFHPLPNVVFQILRPKKVN